MPHDAAIDRTASRDPTAMPAVNAIPAVCAAPPGIATVATLPLVTAVVVSP
ncbi:hypothetical protein FrEUN1fDRAFT_3539 [Parafrankia sp. EUN1f]|nr:hypothetical protein FrEUN1fDRAFT_3539 [Parafrankia sp. EUN1f]